MPVSDEKVIETMRQNVVLKDVSKAYFDQMIRGALAVRDLCAEREKEAVEILTELYEDCVEYVKINNLHSSNGGPASNHAMRRAAAYLKAMGGKDVLPNVPFNKLKPTR